MVPKPDGSTKKMWSKVQSATVGSSQSSPNTSAPTSARRKSHIGKERKGHNSSSQDIAIEKIKGVEAQVAYFYREALSSQIRMESEFGGLDFGIVDLFKRKDDNFKYRVPWIAEEIHFFRPIPLLTRCWIREQVEKDADTLTSRQINEITLQQPAHDENQKVFSYHPAVFYAPMLISASIFRNFPFVLAVEATFLFSLMAAHLTNVYWLYRYNRLITLPARVATASYFATSITIEWLTQGIYLEILGAILCIMLFMMDFFADLTNFALWQQESRFTIVSDVGTNVFLVQKESTGFISTPSKPNPDISDMITGIPPDEYRRMDNLFMVANCLGIMCILEPMTNIDMMKFHQIYQTSKEPIRLISMDCFSFDEEVHPKYAEYAQKEPTALLMSLMKTASLNKPRQLGIFKEGVNSRVINLLAMADRKGVEAASNMLKLAKKKRLLHRDSDLMLEDA